MLSSTKIEHIAQLARIEISEKEKKRYTKELGRILDFVEQLNQVNTEKVTPLYQTTGISNQFRPDTDDLTTKLKRDLSNFAGQFPEREGNFLRVKNVF